MITVPNLAEAKAIQQELRLSVITKDELDTINYVAGIDVALKENNKIAQGAVVVLSFPDLQLVESAIYSSPVKFPYVPGFLSFREIEPIIGAIDQLKTTPDLTLCDGHGIAHPYRFGLASHLGVVTGLATMGVAKSLLVGRHESLDLKKGSWQPLIDQNEVIGAVVRTRNRVKPVYVSSGHRISLETAIKYLLACTTKYRLPETTRLADRLSRR